MSSRANVFVYSNASTSRRSGLLNTGLENVIYCSTTTDAGPIQNFRETSLFSGIPYSMKAFIKYKCSIIQLFNPIIFFIKLSIEIHQLIKKCGFREQGVCREKTSVIYYLDDITLFVCPHFQIKSHFISKYLKALHVCVKKTVLYSF